AIAPSAAAQPGQVSGSVAMTTGRTTVRVGEAFRLQIRANVNGAEVDRFELPSELDRFLVRSRQVSRPISFRFGSGGSQVVSSQTVYSFVLEAREPGSVELSPAVVTAGGRTFRSNGLRIEVTGTAAPGATPPPGTTPTPGGQQPGATPQSTPGGQTVAVDGVQYDAQAFFRTTADVAEPYVGQQVTVTVYLYSRAPLRSAPHLTREPSADAFWVQDLLPPRRALEPERQNVGGNWFYVYKLRRFAAFPLREGELTIGAPEMTLQTGGGIFGFGGGQQLERTGTPITVAARALPNPPPNAVVGDYQLSAELDRSQVRTGDALTLTATVQGTGNVRDVRLELPDIDGLQVLQPEIDDQILHPGERVGGTRVFKWLIVPQQPGEHVIPAMTLNLFDPAAETYRPISTPELHITAAGNAVAPAQPDPAQGTTEPTEIEAEPAPTPSADHAAAFGPLRREAALERGSAPVSSQPWYWALLIGLPLLFSIGLGVAKLRARAPDEQATARSRAKERLGDAKKRAAAGEARPFYAAITTALQAALESRLGEPVSGMTHEELRSVLRGRGMEEDLVRRVLDELESCDFARFSSAGGSASEMDACLGRVRGLLDAIDGFRPREAA
ncbi:MAG TPA: BatD family protein, partial [Polyangiaceae bacterium LLY-WYZ-15_(1-7)]|nr:BatD family protein [Polyangiaceae bacterium LLY-WYZ-15_(1-7)]